MNGTGHGLTQAFMEALQDPAGPLHWVLNRVRRDGTLCLEIRGNYINVYYRGGNLMKVSPDPAKAPPYKIYFNPKYLSPGTTLPGANQLADWRSVIPSSKDAMDLWFTQNRRLEREYQQEVTRVNNSPENNSTDYFICDLEYAEDNDRFDMIGVCWPSTSSARKNDKNLRLTFIEMKYGDGVISGDCSLSDHLRDIEAFIARPGALDALADQMREVFNQKRRLGLIDCKKDIASFHQVPEVMLLLADHDPDKTALSTELPRCQPIVERLKDQHGVRTLVAQASFCGYGLYVERLLEWGEFVRVVEPRP